MPGGGYCVKHGHVAAQQEKVRGSSYERGYNSTWRRLSKAYLMRNRFCRECSKEGVLELATEVDHVIPHRGNSVLFWDEGNWQPLCKHHHSRKTATEDSTFAVKKNV